MPENTPNRGYPVPVANDAFEPRSRINALGVAVDADVESVDSAKVDKTTTVTAGAGLTGGGDLSTNRTIAANVGTTAGTLAAGDDSRIVNAVQPARTITAGTGLTGGGDLSANRTLAVDFTAVATASQGAKADGAVQKSKIGNQLATNVANGAEDGTASGWTSAGGFVRESSTDFALRGSRSLKATAGASGNTLGFSGWSTFADTVNTLDVIPGERYTFFAYVYAPAAARNMIPRIYWWQANGTTAASTAFSTGTTVVSGASWKLVSVTGVAPDNAVLASALVVTNAVAGEVFYFDSSSFHYGIGGRFAMPGVYATTPGESTRVKPTDSTVMQLWNPAAADWVDAGAPASLISATVVDAKGDLLVGTADNTVTRLPAPLDGRLLVADSTRAAGYGSVRIGNILHPNLATGTDLLGTIAGIDPVFVGTTATSSTAQAYRGTRSLKIEWTDTTNGRSVVTTEYDVIGGYPYTFAFRSYRVAAGRRLSPQIVWYDAAGAQISAPTTLLADADETVGAWVGQSIVEVSPANAVKGEVRFRGQVTGTAAAGDVHYVDDVMFVAGATDFRFWQPPNVSPANNQRVKPGDPTVMQIWNPQSGAWQDLASSTSVPSHASTHATGGSDPLTPAAIGAATSAQGALADTAVQPGDLGTAAAANTGDFATATQGTLATTAAQRLYHYLTPNMVSGGDTLAATTGFNVQTGTVTLAYTTAEKYAGDGSIQATLGAGATFGFLNVGVPTGIPIPAARPIAFSVAMKAPAGVTASLRVQWRDAAGAAVGSPVVLDTKTADGSWQLFRAATVRPSGATHANHFFGLSSTAGGEVFYVDRVQVDDSLSTVATTGAYSDLSGTPTPLENTVDAKGDLLVGTADNTVTNVGVGSNGQVLTADSGEASGMKWADAAGGDPPTIVSGAYFVTPANVTTTVTPARDTVTLCPVDLPAGTLTRIGVAITSTGGAGTEIRLGIYSDHGGGSSFPLLLDAGTVAADDTATIKEITISQAVSAGRYWLAAVAQNGSGGLPAVRQNSGNVQGCAYLDTNSFAAIAAGYQATGVSGALPATLTPTNGINLSVRVVVR